MIGSDAGVTDECGPGVFESVVGVIEERDRGWRECRPGDLE